MSLAVARGERVGVVVGAEMRVVVVDVVYATRVPVAEARPFHMRSHEGRECECRGEHLRAGGHFGAALEGTGLVGWMAGMHQV